MSRTHLFEFNDLSWYPGVFRRIQTDYLQFVTSLGSKSGNSGHLVLIPLMIKAMQQASTTEIVDLCSGAGGPWRILVPQFAQAGYPVTVKLTDIFPHPEAVEDAEFESSRAITYLKEPVDARQVPVHLGGMRTIFEGFHHFKPDQARSILQDAVVNGAAIGVFEASLKPPFGLLLLLLAPLTTLLGYLFMTPFIKPRRFSRFFWTYLMPVVPLATCWDGVVSLLRVYPPGALKALTAAISAPCYTWEIGLASTGTPIFEYTYLVGYPKN